MLLVDTSVWIDYYAGKESVTKAIDTLGNEYLCTCGVIFLELLPFISNTSQRAIVREGLSSLHYLSTPEDAVLWAKLQEYQTLLKAAGVQGLGIADLILIFLALQHDIPILTSDKHFLLAKKVFPLEVRNPIEFS